MDLTIGILTYNAPVTLAHTLTSYARSSLLNIVNDAVVFVQGNGSKEREICEHFGLRVIGDKHNIGIRAAIEHLLAEASTRYFLFLENDWVCIEESNILRTRLYDAVSLLKNGSADCIRLRSRQNPGEPLYSRQFAGHERENPASFLDCIHWTETPEKSFPDVLKTLKTSSDTWYIATSAYANYSNNPCMYRTDFFRKILRDGVCKIEDTASMRYYAVEKGVSVNAIRLEEEIQDWWRKQNYIVAQGAGCFCHDPQKEYRSLWFSLRRAMRRLYIKARYNRNAKNQNSAS